MVSSTSNGNFLIWWSRSTPAGKWLGFVTAVWVQSISGNNYTFSNYSDAIKTLMGLTQLQLNNLSVAKDVGKAFGIFAGIASDRLPTSVILLIGSIEGLVGYGAQWLVVSKTVAPLPYWQMCVFLCMGGNSTTWMNTAVLVTCMRNFRRNKGPVSGVLKGYVGLSTAIFTDISGALFSNSPSYFLFMLSVVPAVVCLTAMLFLHEVVEEEEQQPAQPQNQQEKNDYFRFFEIIAVVVALYLLTYDLLGQNIPPEAFTVGLLLLLVAPLGLPIYLIFTNYKKSPSSDEEAPLISSEAKTRVEERTEEKDMLIMRRRNDSPPELGEDHSLMEVLKTSEFWVVFISFLCAVGTGLAVQNNMGQMGLAMGYADVSLFVSLISIFGFFGRIGSGFVSEHFIRIAAVPRPFWNAASQILMLTSLPNPYIPISMIALAPAPAPAAVAPVMLKSRHPPSSFSSNLLPLSRPKTSLSSYRNSSAPGPDTECPVPLDQQPVNEYQSLSTSLLFSWAAGDVRIYSSRLLFIGASFSHFVGLPVAAFGKGTAVDPQAAIVAVSSGILVVMLAVLRMYLGWAYVGNRLLSATVEYEETGWYDGQIWVKTPEVLARDRLLGSFSVKPVLTRVKLTLVGLAISLIACTILFINVEAPKKIVASEFSSGGAVPGFYDGTSARLFEPDAFRDDDIET